MPNLPPVIWIPCAVFVVTAVIAVLAYFRTTHKAREWLRMKDKARMAIQSLQSALSQAEASEGYWRNEAKVWKGKAKCGKNRHKAPRAAAFRDNRPKTVTLPKGQPVPVPTPTEPKVVELSGAPEA